MREATDTRDEWARIAGVKEDAATDGYDPLAMIARVDENQSAA